MSIKYWSLLKRIDQIAQLKQHYRAIHGTVSKTKDAQEEQLAIFRTTEFNPTNHNKSHLARFYTVPEYDVKVLYEYGGLPKPFRIQTVTFVECCIQVRNPAIEIISYLNQTNYTRPVNKYVLYGLYGTGRTITLAHIMHYAFKKRSILVHVPCAPNWYKFPREIVSLIEEPGAVDLPVDAGMWLLHFKYQNNMLLSDLNLKVSKDYEWGQREKTVSGTSLLELIDFGIKRVKFATKIIETLVYELKAACIANKCNVLVAIDGYNTFFSESTNIRNDNKVWVTPQQVTLTRPFLEFTKADWCNGAVVVTVEATANKERRESDLPKYLLGKDGFNYLDPFVPICVENYTDAEFDSVIEYYKDRKWIRNLSSKGQEELMLLSNKNPFKLMNLCTSL